MMSHHIPVIWHAQLYFSLNSHSLMYIQYILNDTYIRLRSLIISKLYSHKLIGGDRISQWNIHDMPMISPCSWLISPSLMVVYIYINIITTSLRPHWEWWLVEVTIPKWLYFRLVNYCNLPIYILYTYMYIHTLITMIFQLFFPLCWNAPWKFPMISHKKTVPIHWLHFSLFQPWNYTVPILDQLGFRRARTTSEENFQRWVMKGAG